MNLISWLIARFLIAPTYTNSANQIHRDDLLSSGENISTSIRAGLLR